MVMEEIPDNEDEVEDKCHAQHAVTPEIIRDTGLPFSLFKESELLVNIWKKRMFLMNMNAGEEVISLEGEVPGNNITLHYDEGVKQHVLSMNDLNPTGCVRYSPWKEYSFLAHIGILLLQVVRVYNGLYVLWEREDGCCMVQEVNGFCLI